MEHRDYLNLDLEIEAEGDGYVASIVDSPSGQAANRFAFPFSAPELAQFIVSVGPPRAGARRLAPTGARTTDARDYGRRLFDAALAGEVGTGFRISLDRALHEDKGLRIRLRLADAPDLSTLPWEYLFSESLDRFLALSVDTPIVRFMEVAQPTRPLLVEPPIRVLVMVSDPSDAPGLDVEREMSLLRATTGDLVSSGLMELVFLEDATLQNLQRALYDRYHVFHFIGHGGYDQRAGEGVLVFEDQSGKAQRVNGSRLGTLLHDAHGMQLAILNACEGARTALDGRMSGVAQTLVRQGLPAVVAMQFEISDRAALIFAHEFYFALTRGCAVEAATCEARKAIYISDNEVEWGTPVLFLRADDGRLFELTRELAAPPREARWRSLYDSAVAALKTGAIAAAIPLLEQLAAENPEYDDVGSLLLSARARELGVPEPEVGAEPPEPTEPPEPIEPTEPLGLTEPIERLTEPDGPPIERPIEPQPSWFALHSGQLLTALAVLAALLGALGLRQVLDDGPTPTPTPAGRATVGPTPTRAPTGAPTTDPTATQAPTGTPIKRSVVTAAFRTEPPEIDGDDSDWRGVPAYESARQVFPAGKKDAAISGRWRLAWNTDGLFVYVDVTDPVMTIHTGKPSELWKGDSVHFEFGPDPTPLKRTAGLRRTDVHLMLGPMDQDRVIAAANRVRNGAFRSGDEESGVEVRAVATQQGYAIEAAIPWSVLNVDSEQRTFGLNLNVSDAVASADRFGELAAMVSSNGRRTGENQPRPAQWDLLELAGPISPGG